MERTKEQKKTPPLNTLSGEKEILEGRDQRTFYATGNPSLRAPAPDMMTISGQSDRLKERGVEPCGYSGDVKSQLLLLKCAPPPPAPGPEVQTTAWNFREKI